MKKPLLNIIWAKAYGEPYCHHASLFIPIQSLSLFSPELIHVGITVRMNIFEKGIVSNWVDTRIAFYLPCAVVNGGLNVPLNSSDLIDALGVNIWTSLKGNKRGNLKEFPINIFYQLEEDAEVILPFDYDHNGTPFLMIEKKLLEMSDGDKIESVITFDE